MRLSGSSERVSRPGISVVKFSSRQRAVADQDAAASRDVVDWQPSPRSEVHSDRCLKPKHHMGRAIARVMLALMTLGVGTAGTAQAMYPDWPDQLDKQTRQLIFDQQHHAVPPLSKLDDQALAHKIEPVQFKSDGQTLNGWYVSPQPGKPTVVFAHGRSGNRANVEIMKFMKEYTDLGYGFMAFDYRGYGDSPGTATAEGLFHDYEAASDFLTGEKRTPVSDQIAMGYSLGGGVVVHVASERQFKALVVLSSFTSIPAVVSNENVFHYQKYKDVVPEAAHWFLETPGLGDVIIKEAITDDFDSLAAIGNVKCPVYILHGDKDDYIPDDMGKALNEHVADGVPHVFHTLKDATHNNVGDYAHEIVSGATQFIEANT